MRHANITPALRQTAILCGASWPFRQAATVLFELTGVEISHEEIRRLCATEAKSVNTQETDVYQKAFWDALTETMEVLVEYLDPDTADERPPTASTTDPERIYFGIDSTFVNAKAAKRFIEAKAGIVFTDDRIQVGARRFLLINKQYTGTFQSVEVFGEKLFTTAREMGVNDSTELIILADGARWITKLAKTQYPQATLILDWWHLNKRVWETVDWLKLHGLAPKAARDWGRQIRDWLWRGNVFTALKSCVRLGKQMGLSPPVGKSQTELGETSLQSFYLYLKNNFEAIIDYHTFKRNGYYISSVVAEKTIDLLVCRRQKLRGQNWSREGAENILTFRKLILNGQWKDHWQQRQAA